MVTSIETEAPKVLSKPYFDLGQEQQCERLALAQRMVRAIPQDLEVSFRRDPTGVVLLKGGSADNSGEVIAVAADVNGYAVDALRRARAMQLSMRQPLRLPRRCTGDEVYEARRALTPYDAVAVSARGHGGKKHAAAAVFLADLVGEQVRLAQEKGVFTPPKGHKQDPRVSMRGRHAIVPGRCHPLRCVCWGLAWWPSECGQPRQLGNVVGHGRKWRPWSSMCNPCRGRA